MSCLSHSLNDLTYLTDAGDDLSDVAKLVQVGDGAELFWCRFAVLGFAFEIDRLTVVERDDKVRFANCALRLVRH